MGQRLYEWRLKGIDIEGMRDAGDIVCSRNRIYQCLIGCWMEQQAATIEYLKSGGCKVVRDSKISTA